MRLKIVSLNLAGFKGWESRRQKVISFLADESPDVVLLQEVQFNPDFSPYAQSVHINKLLKTPFPFTQTAVSKFYQSGSGNIYREGLAVLSRFPIVNSEALVLTKQPDDKHPRIVQNVDLATDGQKILLSNIHFSNNAYAADQLREFLSILKSRSEERIIAGDFNISDLEEHKKLWGDEYTVSIEAKEYISFPSENRTLDYVLLPKEMSLESLGVHEGLSDHNALVFTVSSPKQS